MTDHLDIHTYRECDALSLSESGRIDVTSMVYRKIPAEELPSILADKRACSLGKYIVNC